jgi:hypothetical protein
MRSIRAFCLKKERVPEPHDGLHCAFERLALPASAAAFNMQIDSRVTATDFCEHFTVDDCNHVADHVFANHAREFFGMYNVFGSK